MEKHIKQLHFYSSIVYSDDQLYAMIYDFAAH